MPLLPPDYPPGDNRFVGHNPRLDPGQPYECATTMSMYETSALLLQQLHITGPNLLLLQIPLHLRYAIGLVALAGLQTHGAVLCMYSSTGGTLIDII